MKIKITTFSVAVACLAGILGPLLAGCDDKGKVGDTVPAPPRELAEKSLRLGGAPIAPPAGKGTPGAPASR